MTTLMTWRDVADATVSLLGTASRLRPGDETAPSLCAGWTRGHVLTHLARNADAIGSFKAAWQTGSISSGAYVKPDQVSPPSSLVATARRFWRPSPFA